MINSLDNSKDSFKVQFIRLLDVVISCLFLAPMVVIYWRTTWLLMDLYIYPQHHVTSAAICAITGCTSSLFIVLLQRDIIRFLSEYNELVSKIIWKICIYPVSLSCIAYWRGVWMIADYSITTTSISFVLCHSISFIFLAALRTVSSVVSAPCYYTNDLHLSLSTVTLPSIPWSRDNYTFIKYIFHCLLTVFLVGVLVVLYWRATWYLWDYITGYNTVNNLPIQVLCYGISCCVCIVCYMVSKPCETLLINSTSCPALVKIALEHVFVYIIGCCAVNIWRSVWYIWDLVFLKGKHWLID